MSNRLKNLADAGVSIWLDDLSRDRLDSGNLADLVANQSVTGVTNHRIDKPGIFHTEWSSDRTESTLDAGKAKELPPEPAEKADPSPA